MHQAASYQRSNQMQRNDAEKITEEDHLQWRLDGRDTLLDVGCGSGDVLVDYIYPLLPKSFELLLGTDISPKMVDYANQNCCDDKRVKFRVLDIATEVIPKDLYEKFDHVTSFYCLHWVQNQRQALRNIHKLLRKDGGDCLLVFLASAPLYDIYKAFSKQARWSPYLSDVDEYIAPLHCSKNPVQEFSALLAETSFVDCKVELRSRTHYFQSVENLKSTVRAICPFLERMPQNDQIDFLEEFVKSTKEKKFYELNANTKELRFFTPYNLLVVYARKPSDFFRDVIGNNELSKGPN